MSNLIYIPKMSNENKLELPFTYYLPFGYHPGIKHQNVKVKNSSIEGPVKLGFRVKNVTNDIRENYFRKFQELPKQDLIETNFYNRGKDREWGNYTNKWFKSNLVLKPQQRLTYLDFGLAYENDSQIDERLKGLIQSEYLDLLLKTSAHSIGCYSKIKNNLREVYFLSGIGFILNKFDFKEIYKDEVKLALENILENSLKFMGTIFQEENFKGYYYTLTKNN